MVIARDVEGDEDRRISNAVGVLLVVRRGSRPRGGRRLEINILPPI